MNLREKKKITKVLKVFENRHGPLKVLEILYFVQEYKVGKKANIKQTLNTHPSLPLSLSLSFKMLSVSLLVSLNYAIIGSLNLREWGLESPLKVL